MWLITGGRHWRRIRDAVENTYHSNTKHFETPRNHVSSTWRRDAPQIRRSPLSYCPNRPLRFTRQRKLIL